MPTTVLAERPAADDDVVVPRRISTRNTAQDQVFVAGARSVAGLTFVIVGSIGVFLALQSRPTLKHYGLSFFTEHRWLPNTDQIGILSVLIGTVEVATVALVMSIPLAYLTALFITDWAPAWLKPTMVRFVDLMAAVPGIVVGLFVLFVLERPATEIAHWMSKYLAWIPIFKVHTDVNYADFNQAPGYPSYAGSVSMCALAVALIIFPMATSVMREVFGEAPVGEKEAAIALGATRWAMVRTVVIPFGKSGVIGGSMLALGRALGETISVVLILSQSFEIKVRVLESGTQTISGLIVTFYKEATPAQLSALLTAGFVLFLITMLVNMVAAMIVNRSRSGAGTDL